MNTKYICGFPEQVEISNKGMRIEDIEHLIVSLNVADNVHRCQKVSLMNTYKEVRAKYWDTLYDMNEERKVRINELGMKLIGKVNDMYTHRDHLLKLELDKKGNGKLHAYNIYLKMSVKQPKEREEWPLEKSLCRVLFQFPEEIPSPYNIYESEVYVDEDEDMRGNLDINNDYYAKLQEDGINNMAHGFKKDFRLAWKDLEHVGEWEMKVDYYY